MNTDITIRAMLQNLIAVIVIFVLSLVGATILFTGFESFAEVNGTKMKLGGAIAGFFIIFIVLKTMFSNLMKKSFHKELFEKQQIIKKLEAKLEDIQGVKYSDLVAPKDFVPRIIDNGTLGFCHPPNWRFEWLPEVYNICCLFKPSPNKPNDAQIAASVTAIGADFTEDNSKDLFEHQTQVELHETKGAKLEKSEELLLCGLPMRKNTLSWIDSKENSMKGMLVLVLTADKKRIYKITLTALSIDYDEAVNEFIDMLGTFQFS